LNPYQKELHMLNNILASILATIGIGSCCQKLPAVCPERTGGAEITFRVADEEQITLWITDEDFIEEAIRLLGEGAQRVPNFLEVIPAPSCVDDQWSWHVDPAAVEWADFTIELCDGRPSYIEDNLCSWIREVRGWCPWSAVVVSIEDFR
jgi:hypothetical protein